MSEIIKGSVFIGYTHHGTVEAGFLNSIVRHYAADIQGRRLLYGFGARGGLYVVFNRNLLAKDFLDSPCEWLFCVDADEEWNATQLEMLLDVADPVERPIVTGLYFGYIGDFNKRPHPVPVWFGERPDGMTFVVPQIKHGLQEIQAAGMGFCLIHRSVFEKIKEVYGVVEKDGKKYVEDWPWFGHDPIYTEDVIEERDGEPYYKLVHSGEDITFFKRARALGFKIWAHGGVSVNHVKKRIENVDTFLASGDVKVKSEEASPECPSSPSAHPETPS